MGQIRVDLERSIVSMADANMDTPSELNVASELVYRFENGDQKRATSV